MLIDPVATHARAKPRALAAVDLDSGRRWDWAALDADINRVANWLIGEETAELAPETCGWVYPECVPFARERVERLAAEAGLAVRFCPWPHGGGLSWFVMARSAEALPSEEELARLAVPPLERP